MKPGPGRIVETLRAYWQTEALHAALELGIFTALGRRALGVADLARACHGDERSMRVLCDYLVSQRFLRKESETYRNTVLSARFLDARSPASLVDVPAFFTGPSLRQSFARLAETVRHGGARSSAATPRHWRDFARSTWRLRQLDLAPIARELRRRRLARGRILDIGAGASALGLALLPRPRTTTRDGSSHVSLVVQDRPAVVKVALERAAAAGLADRVAARAGDALTMDLGGPYDLALMTNVLDYVAEPRRRALIERARAVLVPGGVLAISAPFLKESRVAPPEAAAYGLMLLALGAGGQPCTVRELRCMLRQAGFNRVIRCASLPLVLARTPLGGR